MTTKTNILTITTLFLFLNAFGQTDEKVRKYVRHDGLVSDLAICFDCGLDSIVQTIKGRLTDYPIDTKAEFRKEKGDTLIEMVSFNNNGHPDYSYYHNNLLKVHYSKLDSNDFTLTVMNDFEMESKQWIVHPNEVHMTDYDENSRMNHYFAQIYPDNQTKIEFEKKWNNGKFVTGTTITYKLKSKAWELQNTANIGELDWPQKATTNKTKKLYDSNIPRKDLFRINSAHHWGQFELNDNDWLEPSNDSSNTFLPLKLKSGIENGTYKIYKKINKKWESNTLLIDANILDGQLHGVYNEYDLKTGKIKIYCIYNYGKLNGRRTIYEYQENGEYNSKTTELWENGIFIEIIH